MAMLDVTGERYGRLVALRRVDKKYKNRGHYWAFQCDCGNVKEYPLNSVRAGLVKSCGCLHRPHGKSKTRLHRIWCDMRERCRNDGHKSHERWAGKGITVCEEWNDYLTFEEWALSHGYKDDLTIDRIDNDKGYNPDNCRWATYSEQARNTSHNRYININGESHIVKDWCEILKTVTPSTVYKRVRNYGWSIEKALTTPNMRSK